MIEQLEYKIIPSESTETYIDLTVQFDLDKKSKYYCCFDFWSDDINNPVEYLHSTGWFKLHIFVEDCNTVKGCIIDLQELQENIVPKSMFDTNCRLHRIITTLLCFRLKD